MAVTSQNYQAIFLDGLRKNSEYIISRLQEDSTHFTEKDQQRVMNILTYGLRLKDAWSFTRDLLLTVAPRIDQVASKGEWIIYLEKAIELSQDYQDIRAEAEFRFYSGILYKHQGKLDKAQINLNSSLKRFKEIGTQQDEARALNQLAYVARLQRNLEEATKLVTLALQLSTEPKEVAYGHLVLGSIALDKRNWTEAKDHFEKSLALFRKTNDTRKIAWGFSNLGAALRVLKLHEEAKVCYEEAIKLFETIQDPIHQAVARMNLGNLYLDLDQPSKALELYQLAGPVFRYQERRLAKAALNRGIAYQKLQDWKKAEKSYLSSIEYWKQNNDIISQVNVLDGLGGIYVKQELYDKAIMTYKEALTLLNQMKNYPKYEHLHDKITKDLEKVPTLHE